MVQQTNGQQNCGLDAREINLFECIEIFWAHKIFIIFMTVAFALAGFSYATLQPAQKDTYTADAVLEVGSYITSSGEIAILELGGNLVNVITEVAAVDAQMLQGSSSVIKLEATDVQSARARASLQKAIEYILKRHKMVAQKIGEERLIRPTAMVGEIHVQKHSTLYRKKLVVAVSILLGLIFSAILILLRKAYVSQRRRAKDMEGSA